MDSIILVLPIPFLPIMMFKFEKLEFFNADEKDRENPQVKF